MLLGSVLGIIFGASSLYLFLKVSMTVSASIPVAVLAITIFRGLSRAFGIRRATILENNVVQTAGSAGESIAFGVGAAMPALMLLGYELELTRVMLVAVLGGLLGILMMIPLRRAFIVKQHGVLPYPEGTACAKVLIVGEQGGSNAKTVFLGVGFSFIYQLLMQAFKFWEETWKQAVSGITGYNKAVVSLEPSPMLLGVGYIIGPRIASVMVAGGITTALLIVPMIAYFGNGLPGVAGPGPAAANRRDGARGDRLDVRPLHRRRRGGDRGHLEHAQRASAHHRRRSPAASATWAPASRSSSGGVPRTERDLPMSVVFLGSLGLVLVIATSYLIPTDFMGRLVGAVMVVLFGFLFVTVSSRITGVIGSSSNPISGMTIATLLLVCLIFVVLGWVGPEFRLTALSIAGVVCIASSNGGTTSQDLKTGFLVGATPWKQQVAILVGALTSAAGHGRDAFTASTAHTPPVIPTPRCCLRVKAPADELKGTEIGKDGKSYRVWWVLSPRPGVQAGKYLVDESLDGPRVRRSRHRRPDDNRRERSQDPEIQSGAAAALRDLDSRDHVARPAVGAGHHRSDAGDRDAALRCLCAGVCRRRLSAAVNHAADLRRRHGSQAGRRARKFSDEEADMSPGTLMSTGLIAGGSLAGIIVAFLIFLPNLKAKLDFAAQPGGGESFKLSALAGILRDGGGPAGSGHDRQATDLGRCRSRRQAPPRRDRRIRAVRLAMPMSSCQ